LKDGATFFAGDGFEAQVIHTPGHTQGSVSLYLPQDAGKGHRRSHNNFGYRRGLAKKIDIADLFEKKNRGSRWYSRD